MAEIAAVPKTFDYKLHCRFDTKSGREWLPSCSKTLYDVDPWWEKPSQVSI